MSKQENEPVNETEKPETNGTEENQNEPQDNSPEKKLAELNEKYLRLYSEFDNYRKRTSRERVELLKTAGEEIIKSLLPVLDDLERAIRNNETATDIDAVKEGVKLIHQKFRQSLIQKGLEPIDALGKPFDTDLHEAITNIPAPSDDLKGKVIDEVEKGYLLNGKVIRFAKVVVGN